MAKVSILNREDKPERKITLKSWYQGQIGRLGNNKEIKDFSIYGPLSSFYYSARARYGSEYAIKTRSEWNLLYGQFMNGIQEI